MLHVIRTISCVLRVVIIYSISRSSFARERTGDRRATPGFRTGNRLAEQREQTEKDKKSTEGEKGSENRETDFSLFYVLLQFSPVSASILSFS